MATIVYQDGENTRALKNAVVIREDDFFIYVQAYGNDIRIGKKFIIKIEEGNNEKR